MLLGGDHPRCVRVAARQQASLVLTMLGIVIGVARGDRDGRARQWRGRTRSRIGSRGSAPPSSRSIRSACSRAGSRRRPASRSSRMDDVKAIVERAPTRRRRCSPQQDRPLQVVWRQPEHERPGRPARRRTSSRCAASRMDAGRMFTDGENTGVRRVAVLGAGRASATGRRRSDAMIGEKIRIAGASSP